MVAPIERLIRFPSRLRRPRWTVRLRLTVLYGGLFLVAGAAILVITYVLVHHSTVRLGVQVRDGNFRIARVTTKRPPPYFQNEVGPAQGGQTIVSGPPPRLIQAAIDQQRATALHQLLVESGLALGVGTILSMALGWFVAGRVLRPLRTITGTVRTITAENLHERLDLAGPNDEIKELGDTFDGLLGRLEASFEAQRQFVANASHELRSPLARQRTLVEVALGDPAPTIESLRTTHERVLAAGERQERLTEALLMLARGERALERREDVDLAEVAREVLETRRAGAERNGLTLEGTLEAARVAGDQRLIERLVANLVDNAILHNRSGGGLWLATREEDGRAVLSVANTGSDVPKDEIERLFEPFRRLRERTGHSDGFGLGLSIVRAVAAAHGADLTATPRVGGGLQIEVRFGPSEHLEESRSAIPGR